MAKKSKGRKAATGKSIKKASAKRAPARKAKARVRPIPEGQEGATPYICCRDAARALDFYKAAFDAKEVMRMGGPDGKVGHAEFKIGKAAVMISDEFPAYGSLSPETVGGSPVMLYVYVKDVDAFVKRAVEAGAKVETEVADQFYGDRGGKLKDPFGHVWWFASRRENLTPRELKKRAEKMQATAA
jgi:PhnB protein